MRSFACEPYRMPATRPTSRVPGESGANHVRFERRLGIRNAKIARPFISKGQEAADPAGDSILGHGWVGESAKFFEACLLMLETQAPSNEQVVWNVIGQDLHCPSNTSSGSDGRSCRSPEVGIIEVREAIRGCAHLTAHPTLLPRHYRFVGSKPGEHRTDRVTITDDHSINLAHLT